MINFLYLYLALNCSLTHILSILRCMSSSFCLPVYLFISSSLPTLSPDCNLTLSLSICLSVRYFIPFSFPHYRLSLPSFPPVSLASRASDLVLEPGPVPLIYVFFAANMLRQRTTKRCKAVMKAGIDLHSGRAA